MSNNQQLENGDEDFISRDTELTGYDPVEGKYPRLQHVQPTKANEDGTDSPIDFATEETLGEIKTALQAISGYNDQVESKLDAVTAAINALAAYIDTLEASTDGLETLVAGTNTAIAALQTYLDQLEGYTDGVEGLISTLTAKLPAALTAAGNLKVAVLESTPTLPTVTETIFNVTTSSQIALPANANRKSAFVQNISDTDMWVTESQANAAVNASILLVPTATYKTHGAGNVRVVSGTTGKKLLVSEHV